jgi:hypothetical protein
MSITLIKGASQTGKSLIANALRNNQISFKKGALLVDEACDGEPKILLEKILVGVQLPQPAPEDWATSLPWKPNPMIILVGDKDALLETFEEMLPGFTEAFGPVYTIDTGVEE